MRRTPCTLMRSYSSVMVVSSAVMRQSPAKRNACSAIALSFPPLQQKSTSSITRSSLMARRVFHANAKLAAKRGKPVRLFILFIGKIVDSAINTEAPRDIVGHRQIDERVARIDDLRGVVVVVALAGEIA